MITSFKNGEAFLDKDQRLVKQVVQEAVLKEILAKNGMSNVTGQTEMTVDGQIIARVKTGSHQETVYNYEDAGEFRGLGAHGGKGSATTKQVDDYQTVVVDINKETVVALKDVNNVSTEKVGSHRVYAPGVDTGYLMSMAGSEFKEVNDYRATS